MGTSKTLPGKALVWVWQVTVGPGYCNRGWLMRTEAGAAVAGSVQRTLRAELTDWSCGFEVPEPNCHDF